MKKFDIKSENYTVNEILLCEDIHLSDWVKKALKSFSKERIISLLENPQMNPIEYFFDSNYLDKEKYPYSESSATIIQLMEILIACGHVDWLCKEIPNRDSRISILAAFSGHKKLLEAAGQFFNMPNLKKCIKVLRKKRNSLDDILFLSTEALRNDKFRFALTDSISKYCLTCDVSNSLMDPIGWFEGFNDANPGKLSYFYALCPEDYPILNHLWLYWTERSSLPWEDFCHPRGHMLYTKCYHYRTAVVGEAKRVSSNLSSLDKIQVLLRNMPKYIRYYQSGSCEGFINDTTKMAIKLLSD